MILVYNIYNIKFFFYNFVAIALEANKSIEKTKNHELIFKITVLYLKDYYLFITFFNFYLII